MKRWRVGNISMAVILILAGVLLLLSNFTDLSFSMALTIGWPIVMIFLGIEMLLYLYFSKEEKPRIQFDGLSIFFVCLILVGSLFVYGITSVFQSDLAKTWMEERLDRYSYSTTQSDNVDVSNVNTLTLDDPLADIKVIPSDQLRVTRVITIRYNDAQASDQLLTLYRDNINQVVAAEGSLTITGGPGSMHYRMTGARLYVQYIIEKPEPVRLNLVNYSGLQELGEGVANVYTGREWYEDSTQSSDLPSEAATESVEPPPSSDAAPQENEDPSAASQTPSE